MIRYTLTCANEHRFDSWFKSADAFAVLKEAGQLACAVCGTHDVSLALMAPALAGSREVKTPDLNAPMSDAEDGVAKLRAHVEATSEDVGATFAQQARDMHDGTTPQRAIRGTAKLDDAKKLVEDGVPILPLPFMPKRNVN